MNFDPPITRNSLHSRTRPLSSFKINHRHSIVHQATLYNPDTTTHLFYSPGRRSSCRPERTPNKILTLGNHDPIMASSKYANNLTRKSVSKRISESYYMEGKESYLGKYELRDELGKGSFGTVYLAEDKTSSQIVAVKVYEKFKINQDPAKFKNIRREISIMQSVDHPNIVKLIQHNDSLTKINLTLEYCGRKSLYDLIHSSTPMDKSLIRRLLKQTLQAISYLHNKNIVHRDIKAHNLLITDDFSIKLIDFGFSIVTNKTRKLSSICGTPNYMAPQVLRRQEYVGQYSDMWSFGILVYYVLEKRYPFRAETMKQLTRVVNQCKLDFRSCKDQFLQSVVRRCLRHSPMERVSASKLLEECWEINEA